MDCPMRLRTLWFGFAALLSAVLMLAYLRPTARHSAAPPPIPVRPISSMVERTPRPLPLADSVVALALRLRGTNYCYAGTTPAGGFDCSGFLTYVFGRFGLAVPHSSGLQATTGRFVPRHLAQPGDIIIFTGTNAAVREPGHAGIVISHPGEPLRFVHSSSARKNPGVQIDQVDSTRYDTRFLQIRRIIGEVPVQQSNVSGATPASVDSVHLSNIGPSPASGNHPRRPARSGHRRRPGRPRAIHHPGHAPAGPRDRHAVLRHARPAGGHVVR